MVMSSKVFILACLVTLACSLSAPHGRRPRPTRLEISSIDAAGVQSIQPRFVSKRRNVEISGTQYNVKDYGAKGDNHTDDTHAFQSALDTASSKGGGSVYVPPGYYVIRGTLNIPPDCSLEGSYLYVPSHDSHSAAGPRGGSVLHAYAGRGNANGTPFITVNADSAISGFSIFYPDQLPDRKPVAYPPTISMVANNAAATDLELLNSWYGIKAVRAHRHYIARIQGQPINIGVFVDETYDIGRIEDVHFNPWYSPNPTYMEPQTINGRAFVMGRSDWEYVFNTFAFGYAVGYHFIQTSTGSMNGNFLGIGMDLALNASVLVDASQAPGLLITNGEFTSFKNKHFAPKSTADPTQVVVNSGNKGPVKFVTSSFWGPTDMIANIRGSGTVSFDSCTFVQWDLAYKKGSPAILAQEGKLIVQGSEFQMEGTKQIQIESAVKGAVVVGNIVQGAVKIDNKAAKTQIGYNVGA